MATTSAASGAGGPNAESVFGPPRRRIGEKAITFVLFCAAATSVVITIGIVVSLAGETLTFFTDQAVTVSGFLTGGQWTPLFSDPQFGIRPLVQGTLIISGIALIVAIPLGIGTAAFLSEYASPRVRKAVKPTLELLAGVPTVVFGYFALTYFTPTVLNGLLGLDVAVFNGLAGGIIVGILIVPTIASVAEDAMSAVPQSLREGAYGLGASRRQVTVRVVVPAALSGITAGIVLGASRAVGETMVVLIAAGQVPTTSLNPRNPMETMTAFIGATGKGDVPTGSTGYKAIFAVGFALFLMTLILNTISIRFVRRYRQVYE
ncbi:MAG: phosphate ABC transporter permease subunit PstC [Solirubrobacterales bacterium]|nr:phosphate ABC transporter permease subunit PstC [Solirubrobacterales bacterium]